MRDRNYEHNKRHDISEGLITRQRSSAVKALRYGAFSADYNGCAVIATYNLLQLLGKPAPMSQLIKEFVNCSADTLFGLLGTNSFMLGLVLRKHGVRYKLFYGARRITEPGFYLLCYFNGGKPWKGAHCVLTAFDGESYKSYNFRGGISTAEPINFAFHMICGYKILT